MPSSSSHALIGGIVGAVIAKAGTGALLAAGVLKIVAFIFVTPVLGFTLSSLMMVLVAWVFRRSTPSRVDRWFRRLQLVSAGAYSLGHGGMGQKITKLKPVDGFCAETGGAITPFLATAIGGLGGRSGLLDQPLVAIVLIAACASGAGVSGRFH